MLASQTVRRFAGSPSPSTQFLALYAVFFGGVLPLPEVAPPGTASLGHARAIHSTLLEWCSELDAQSIQVHQEGALARFRGAAAAPDAGRHPGAANARRKTAEFFGRVVEAATSASRAHTFLIPATAWQGAAVALAESQATVRRHREAAAAADPALWPADRPELAAAKQAAGAVAGRAAAMHSTALAELRGCLQVAEGGPWLRQLAPRAGEAVDLPAGVWVVGVEVPGNSPVLPLLTANLDPQHGGGTFGLGHQPTGALAACDAALQIVRAGGVLPGSTRYVTARLDPDALVAAMILSGRLPDALFADGLPGATALRELAELDCSTPTTGGWTPGRFAIQSVADHPAWGPVGQATLAASQGRGTLEAAEAAAMAACTGGLVPGADRVVTGTATSRARTPTVSGCVAVGREWTFGEAGQWSRLYQDAPVGILVTETMRFGPPGGAQVTGRKFTVGVARECGAAGAAFAAAFTRRICALESDWGGATTIIGSPQAGPSRLTLEEVVAAAQAAAVEVGIVAPVPAIGLVPGLR